jgi:hypothetical protein
MERSGTVWLSETKVLRTSFAQQTSTYSGGGATIIWNHQTGACSAEYTGAFAKLSAQGSCIVPSRD